jgi:hypothetical protein
MDDPSPGSTFVHRSIRRIVVHRWRARGWRRSVGSSFAVVRDPASPCGRRVVAATVPRKRRGPTATADEEPIARAYVGSAPPGRIRSPGTRDRWPCTRRRAHSAPSQRRDLWTHRGLGARSLASPAWSSAADGVRAGDAPIPARQRASARAGWRAPRHPRPHDDRAPVGSPGIRRRLPRRGRPTRPGPSAPEFPAAPGRSPLLRLDRRHVSGQWYAVLRDVASASHQHPRNNLDPRDFARNSPDGGW